MDFRPTFQQNFGQKFEVAVGTTASILAPAVFLNRFTPKSFRMIFHVVEKQRNGDESIIDGHH